MFQNIKRNCSEKFEILHKIFILLQAFKRQALAKIASPCAYQSNEK
jgi:hypothetical protein